MPEDIRELRDKHNDQCEAGGDGADAIDGHAASHTITTLALPVDNHSRLREREREEGTDSEQWDQAIGDAAEDDQQECGEADQGNDAIGVKQTAPPDF